MSEAKESENQPTETEGSPIYVVATKKFPSGAQLTKATVDGVVFYIRENAVVVSRIQSEQVLEILAPDHMWERCCQVVQVEDSLKRRIAKNPEFTILWAETELASVPQG